MDTLATCPKCLTALPASASECPACKILLPTVVNAADAEHYQTLPKIPRAPAKAALLPIPPLAVCLGMDVVGMFTFIIPGLGEFADVIWAPVSGLIFYSLFRQRIGAAFAFAEEILPFTDVIPTFTASWFLRKFSS